MFEREGEDERKGGREEWREAGESERVVNSLKVQRR